MGDGELNPVVDKLREERVKAKTPYVKIRQGETVCIKCAKAWPAHLLETGRGEAVNNEDEGG